MKALLLTVGFVMGAMTIVYLLTIPTVFAAAVACLTIILVALFKECKNILEKLPKNNFTSFSPH